jgi:hypothetical protein
MISKKPNMRGPPRHIKDSFLFIPLHCLVVFRLAEIRNSYCPCNARKATKDRTLVAIFVLVKELLKSLYQ